MSVQEAAARVPDGAHLVIGGFADTMNPMALVRALVARRVKGLELSAVAEAWSAELLVAAGSVSKLRMSNLMFEGLGRCRAIARAIEDGLVETEDYSHFALVSRLAAGGEGLPFAAVTSMMETSLETIHTFDKVKGKRFTEPFFGETVYLLPRLNPDIALVHAARADQEGNVQLFGPSAIVQEQVRAAREVIVSVEEIVEGEVARAAPAFTIIPGFLVSAIVWAPFGAHPTGLFRYYGPDKEHLAEYYEASRSARTTAEYLERYVWSLNGDPWGYLDCLGNKWLNALRADPYWGYARRAHTQP